MKNLLQFLTVFLFSTFLIFGQSDCTPIPEVNFPGGRVIMSFDGNVHDDDDIVAMGLSAGLWWAAGLQDKVVQIEYNNHVCSVNVVESDGLGPGKGYDGQNMRTTAAGTISNFGYDPGIFYDYETVANASTSKMASEIEKSTASNPLWIIAGGPMETVWRGLEKATKGHADVIIISHSKWNQDHTHCNGANNWDSLKNKYQSKGIFFVENCSGTACNSTAGLNDQNGGFNSAISNWTWMRDSANDYNQWIFSRNPFGSYFDPSDAGMSYFLITGGPFNGGNKSADHNDARKLMENPCQKQNSPKPTIAPSLTITSPLQGQIFEIGKEAVVQISASDDGFIMKHQIFVNNLLVDSDGSSYSPHTINILNKETYIIRAEVTDNDGVKTTKTITIEGEDNDETIQSNPPTTPVPPTTSSDFNISSPSEGDVFKTGETIIVNLASTGAVITQHKIYVNDRLVDTDGTNFTPHRITNTQSGSYTIRGEITDSSGKISTKTINVTVGDNNTTDDNDTSTVNDNPPVSGAPDFKFTSPANGQNFNSGTNILVNLEAAGTTNEIVKYEIFINEILVDTDGVNFTPYSIVNSSNGIYSIRAKVTSRTGKSTTKSITVTVGSGNTENTPITTNESDPITMSVTPSNGKIFDSGDTVIVNVSANSSRGNIVKYQIFVDGLLVDTDGTNFTVYSIKNIANGSHTILVEVTDVNGNKKSQTSQITVGTILGAAENNLLLTPLIEELPSMQIVQNPVQSANLKVDLKGNMNLTIFDLNGVMIQQITDVEDTVDLDVSGLAPGVYILKSATKTAKFIIPGF